MLEPYDGLKHKTTLPSTCDPGERGSDAAMMVPSWVLLTACKFLSFQCIHQLSPSLQVQGRH